MAFPEGFIQELKARNDITEIISSYVSLKRRGRNMVGLCPFHGEKTPSFNIYTETDSFYCFGCGAAGDVISFIMKIENLDYVEAVRYLAQRAGMEMPDDNYDNSMSNLRRQIYEANREAARFFYKTLMSPQGKPGLDYLHGRMLSDKTIRHFGLGFAPDSWTALSDRLREKGFSENVLTAANLAVKEKLLDIRERILAGERFATLARIYSEDTGSARRGGELGMASKSSSAREPSLTMRSMM